MRVAVIVASTGRPQQLAELTSFLNAQTHTPCTVLYSVVNEDDLPERDALYSPSEVVFGSKGLCAQRNRGLTKVLGNCDAIAFLDDDYLPSKFMLEGISKFFEASPEYVGVTGVLLADGINSAGVSLDDAKKMIMDYDASPSPEYTVTKEKQGLYGCNMAYRASAISDERFDEKLALYGWQEDIDFAASLMKKGRLGKSAAFVGVHRGVKGGRTSGVKLGYSQIANPTYLIKKGTMTPYFGMRLMVRNFLANHAKALRPEPWVDRWGRVKGNWKAIFDVLRNKEDPRKVQQM